MLRNKAVRTWIAVILAGLLAVFVLVKLVNFFRIDINHIPKGTLIEEVQSPDQRYAVRAYLVNGGATVDYAVRGELVFLEEDKKPRNIYWDYHRDSAVITWTGDDVVRINNITLNVPDEVYDFRLHNP